MNRSIQVLIVVLIVVCVGFISNARPTRTAGSQPQTLEDAYKFTGIHDVGGAGLGDMDEIEAQFIELFKFGMEPNSAGFHLVVPGEITRSDSNASLYWPSLWDYAWGTSWAFWIIESNPAHAFYPLHDPRNATHEAALSYRRVLGNHLFAFSLMPGSGGLYSIQATMTEDVADQILGYLGTPLESYSDYYKDWFGRAFPVNSAQRTSFVVSLVSNDTAYRPNDIGALISSSQLSFIVADGLDLETAQLLIELLG